MKTSNDPIKQRQYILNQIVILTGTWDKTGCNDEGLEKEIDSLISQLHPVKKTALDILFQHLSMEVAA